MKRKQDNLPHDDSAGQSDENIRRLLKLADGSNKPGRAFTELLIDRALGELKRPAVNKKNGQHAIVRGNWPEKAMGWAAMVAVACGGGLTIVVSALLKMNLLVQAVVVLTMFFNWLTYLGGRIL
jgi:site-specific recombinase